MTGLGTVLFLGLLAGLDNLQVGAGLGLVRMERERRLALAGSFLLCETVMPLAGFGLGSLVQRIAGPMAEGIGTLVLALCGGLITFAALRENRREQKEDDKRTGRLGSGWLLLIVLPLSLSFDNLFVGLGLGSLGYPVVVSSLLIGGISGGLGCVGLFTGARVRRWIPEWAELLSGAYLVALAAFRFLRDLA
jgi:putative Mn2+ efflux pump MntP